MTPPPTSPISDPDAGDDDSTPTDDHLRPPANLGPVGHDPVLMREVLHWLDVRPGDTFIDCTLGRAGHASAVAARLGPTGLLIGTDVDPRNLEFAQQRLKDAPCKVRLFHANFAELADVLAEVGVSHVDAILADLGLSTNQL